MDSQPHLPNLNPATSAAERPPFAWRLIRWALLALAVPGASQTAQADSPRLGPFEYPQPRAVLTPVGSQPFDPVEALNGALASRETCDGDPQRLWIEVEGRSDCIRYYARGLAAGPNPVVMIYIGGDVMLRTPKGVRYVSPSYAKQSPATIDADMKAWSERAGVPAIYLARPGIYGSSGDHNQRRLPREIALMERTVDMLKTKYDISSFVLTGHSAGGQIVAAMLNHRDDVSGVFISSGMVSVKQVANFWEKRRRIPGRLLYNAKAFYDPVTEIGRIPADRPPAIWVLSDPEDRSVPFFSQLYYVRKLRMAKLQPYHMYLQAPDPQRHLLADYARVAAALFARGETPEQIRRALLEMNVDQTK